MTILYDQSAWFEGLVLGTSNKTELLLGYGTQFGDMASAINPIGDLYKTQLYPLAEYLGIPGSILSKTPTGDLWIGQTDEGELGFTYADVDRMLYLLVDRRWQVRELVAAGFDSEFVQRVTERVRRNHYKRRLPIIAKLSSRTMDRDFRYPAIGELSAKRLFRRLSGDSLELTHVCHCWTWEKPSICTMPPPRPAVRLREDGLRLLSTAWNRGWSCGWCAVRFQAVPHVKNATS